jgi:anti-sigma regulatory factor (Ser/Thr protein kinase)
MSAQSVRGYGDEFQRHPGDRGGSMPAMTADSRWVALPRALESPSRSRAFVREVLVDWGLLAIVDDALLLVSELASNAVLHARSGLVVSVTRSPDGRLVRVTVRDDECDVEPTLRNPGPGEASGRGLGIVQTVATCWGVVRDRDGKSVWFELLARP